MWECVVPFHVSILSQLPYSFTILSGPSPVYITATQPLLCTCAVACASSEACPHAATRNASMCLAISKPMLITCQSKVV